MSLEPRMTVVNTTYQRVASHMKESNHTAPTPSSTLACVSMSHELRRPHNSCEYHISTSHVTYESHMNQSRHTAPTPPHPPLRLYMSALHEPGASTPANVRIVNPYRLCQNRTCLLESKSQNHHLSEMDTILNDPFVPKPDTSKPRHFFVWLVCIWFWTRKHESIPTNLLQYNICRDFRLWDLIGVRTCQMHSLRVFRNSFFDLRGPQDWLRT